MKPTDEQIAQLLAKALEALGETPFGSNALFAENPNDRPLEYGTPVYLVAFIPLHDPQVEKDINLTLRPLVREYTMLWNYPVVLDAFPVADYGEQSVKEVRKIVEKLTERTAQARAVRAESTSSVVPAAVNPPKIILNEDGTLGIDPADIMDRPVVNLDPDDSGTPE